jgi:hypothetical protein
MPGFWVLTGLVLFFLNQNDVILVKNKKKTKVNGFATESYRVSRVAGSTRQISRVTSGFLFPCFFFNPAWFQPRVGRVPGRPAGPGFKTMLGTLDTHI